MPKNISSRETAPEGPPCLDLADIVAADYPPLKQYVPGLVVPGLTLLCSRPKVGKSWLVLDWALAMRTGGIAMGELQCEQADEIMLLALEDSPRRLKSRACTLLRDPRASVPRGITVFTQWPRGEKAADYLDRTLDANPAVKVVIIDVVQKIRGESSSANGGDSAYGADYDALERIQRIAHDRDVAIIGNHHLRKMNSGEMLDMVSGTLGIPGVADHIIILKKGETNDVAGRPIFRLYMTGRDLPEFDKSIVLDNGQWRFVGAATDKRGEAMRLRGEGLSATDIAEQLGVSAATVRSWSHRKKSGGAP